MIRSIPRFAVVGLLACVGCKSAQPIADVPGNIVPPLLIGPNETATAPPPPELPKKETTAACLQTAYDYEKKGLTEAAISLYEKARTTAEPASAKFVSRRLAVLYDKVGDFSKSAAEYEPLVKANPKDADLLNDYGYSYYCQRDLVRAEEWYAKAVQVDPKHKKACTNLGLVQAMQGKWKESYDSFARVVRPADAHCNIAFAMVAQGRTEEAKAEYRQALAIDPGQRVAHAALAMLENPQQFASRAEQAKKKLSKYDTVEMAMKVPSVADLEARLVQQGALKPNTLGPDLLGPVELPMPPQPVASADKTAGK